MKISFRAFILGLALSLTGDYAGALNGRTALIDFHHDSWTGKDGAPADVTCMAQTADGWLWIGSSNGLYRFDGIRFTRFEALPGEQLSRRPITALTALRNGDLFIGHTDGTPSLIHDGHVREYPSVVGKSVIGPVYNAIVDEDGTPLLATTRGLLKLEQGVWNNVSASMGLPTGSAINLMLDQYGQIWVGFESGLFVLDRHARRFRSVLQGVKVVNLNESPDGRLWLDTHDKLIAVPPQHQGPDRSRPMWLSQAISQENGLFDRNGNFWSLMCPVGICLTAGVATWPGAELRPLAAPDSRLNQAWQLSSLTGNTLFEDRDGNIWVGTQKGLDRFRNNRLSPVNLQGGERTILLAKDGDGTAWALGVPGNQLWQLRPDGSVQLKETLPEMELGATIASGSDGALLVTKPDGIERRLHGRVERITYPGGQAPAGGDVVNRLLDDGLGLWLSITHRGTFFQREGKWLKLADLGLPSNLFFASPGRTGAMWLGFLDGLVVHYDHGALTRYPATPVGAITFLADDHGVVAGGDIGLAVLDGQHFRLLKTAAPDVLASVTGMVVQPNGDRLLQSAQGVVLVRAADWAAALAAPERPLNYTLHGVLDGFTGSSLNHGRIATAVGDAAGQLWFVNTSGLLHFDTTQAPQPQLAPQLKIEALTSQGRRYQNFAAPLQLAAATTSFRIEYTALSYARPELLNFVYQLQGVDAGWQQGGSRRAMSYTNLGPGDYRFRVIATDDLGQRSEAAEIAIRILPTFRQTPWFYGLCALAGAGALYLLYLMRLKQAMLRLGERLAERERIARTLHDSFLQSVQGLILSFYTVVGELPGDSAGRRKMERVLALAERVMEEGRDEVQELRSNVLSDGDPGRALGFVGEVLQDSYDSVFSLRQQGLARALNEDAACEIYRIGREALLNAFRHSGAKSIGVQLDYGAEQFTLRVVDDGCGIAPAILSQGRDGHWGLPGMLERAARIGARLAIDAPDAGGTLVELVVPAARAYARKRRWTWRWK